MDNYTTIAQKLQTLTPFKGNTLTSFWDGEIYKVFSYSTLIAVSQPSGKVVASAKYSVTTSKHQNIIRRAWGVK